MAQFYRYLNNYIFIENFEGGAREVFGRKLFRTDKKLVRDRRGLSDLMVVLLMLAIAVVVAAAVGAVVMSKAPSSTAPTASLVIKNIGSKILISHNGGDAISLGDLRIHLYEYPNMTYVSGYPMGVSGLASCPATNCITNPGGDGLLNNGDNIQLSPGSGNYLVKVEYVPLGQTISEAFVTVP